MVGVILDIFPETFSGLSHGKSLLDLPLFETNFLDNKKNKLSLLGVDEIYVVNDKNFSDVINNLRRLNDNVLVTFSNDYTEFEDDLFCKSKNLLESFYLGDKDNAVWGLYCSSGFSDCVVTSSSDVKELYNKITNDYFSFSTINCVNMGYAINSWQDYFKLINYVLKGKSSILLPETAEGIYTAHIIPKGDYIIIPPVYLGKNVQIEKQSVIGPDVIIGDDVLIAQSTVVKNSVLLDKTYISNNCYLDGVMCFANVSVRRGSVVFDGSVIGENTLIGEEVTVENNSFVRADSRLCNMDLSRLDYGIGSSSEHTVFYGFSPEKAARLGACLGNVLGMPSVAILGDGEVNSTALKLSLMGGMLTTGAECFDYGNGFFSSIYYFMSFCELQYGIFVSGNKTGTVIYFVSNKGGLSQTLISEINDMMVSGEVTRANKDACKKVRVIRSLGKLYAQSLVRDIIKPLSFCPVIICQNKEINYVTSYALSRLEFDKDNDKIIFKINEQGTGVTAEYDGAMFSKNQLQEICAYFDYVKGQSAELWRNDAVTLVFRLIGVLTDTELDLITACNAVPQVYIAEKEVSLNANFSNLASHIGKVSAVVCNNNTLFLDNDDVSVKIIKNACNSNYKIIARASSYDYAQEIVGDLCDFIKRLDKQ